MIESSKLFTNIPKNLRDALIECYEKIVCNYLEHKWEPSELNGGKFCEVVYSIINGYLSGAYPPKASKPSNMLLACQTLEKKPANSNLVGDRSVRILIPRILPILYEIRNNRGVGHIGGDVDPNYLDATAVQSMSSWILAELIRIFHNTSINEAQEIVDNLIERKTPLVWEVGEVRRVLNPSLKKGDQVLLLLHTRPGWVKEKDLFVWIEYSNLNMFKKSILSPFHSKRFIEYDKKTGLVKISPLGAKYVEDQILKEITL